MVHPVGLRRAGEPSRSASIASRTPGRCAYLMLELSALDWPSDRAALLALDTSYVSDRTLRLELGARSVSLVEQVLPAAMRRTYRLDDIVDALADYAWVRVARDGGSVVGLAALALEAWNRRARLEH